MIKIEKINTNPVFSVSRLLFFEKKNNESGDIELKTYQCHVVTLKDVTHSHKKWFATQKELFSYELCTSVGWLDVRSFGAHKLSAAACGWTFLCLEKPHNSYNHNVCMRCMAAQL